MTLIIGVLGVLLVEVCLVRGVWRIDLVEG